MTGLPEPTDRLQLTAYLGERQRVNNRFAADEIVDLFARRGVASCVLLRGIAGFGGHHVLRTDQSLSLSEDPPITIAAVDTPDVIAPLAGDVGTMMRRGLITLEQARMLDATATALGVPDSDTVRLTVSLGRNRRVDGVPAFAAVCDLLYRNRFAGATAFLGVDGTSHGERRRAHFFSRNLDVPLVIVAFGTAAQVAAVLPTLYAKVDRPLVMAEPVLVCKREGVLVSTPDELPDNDNGRPLWHKLTVATSEVTRYEGVPIHRSLVRRLRESRTASGATVLRGVWGFHGNRPPHGDKLIQIQNGRQVPVTTVIVDTPANIRRSFEIVDQVTQQHGVVTCQTVTVPARRPLKPEDGSAQ